jgi:hypothetical protein
LQLAASAVPQNWNEQNQRDYERRRGDKESITTRARFLVAWI